MGFDRGTIKKPRFIFSRMPKEKIITCQKKLSSINFTVYEKLRNTSNGSSFASHLPYAFGSKPSLQ
jgi:hypothetical protein